MSTTPAVKTKPGRRGTWLAAATAAGAIVLASPDLMSFLGRWEGDGQFVVYADKLAGGLPTVCRGLTSHVTSTPIVVGERWSPSKCEREERAAVIKVQQQLAPCFLIQPSQAVFDMATSHAWNLGAASTCDSGAMKAWNRGEWDLGCQRLSRGDDGRMVWSFTSSIDASGRKQFRFVQGLANRRAAETARCAGAAS